MAIHRWGEGVWARSIAIAVAVLFIVWGSASLYGVPVGYASILERGDVVLPEQWDAAIAYAEAGGPRDLMLEGLESQPLSEELVGQKVALKLGVPGRGVLVDPGDELTPATISALRDAGFTSVPIKDIDTQKLDSDRIVDVCRVAERVGAQRPRELIAAGTVVDPDNLQELQKLLESVNPPLGVRKEGEGLKLERSGQPFELREIQQLAIDDKFLDAALGAPADETLAEAGTLIDAALYQRLKTEGILQVRVEPKGRLPISAATKAKLAGWFVTADENLEQPTFWTTGLFLVPVVDWQVDWGMVICTLVAVVLLTLAWRYLNRTSVADYLIETQGEMKKVSWPSSKELIGSSLVVIAFIVVISMFLFGADVLFAGLARLLRIYPEST